VRGQGVASERVQTPARPDPDEEVQLIARVRARDLRAFERLYRDYRPRLTRFLIHLIHRPNLVEEILDDTMLVVWSQPDMYDSASKLSTWIFAIAYRKGLNALKRQDDPVEDEDPEFRASTDAGPEQQVGARQAREVLLRTMGQLSPDHRAVVDLTYFQEIGYREIAEIMKCPVDTVKSRMYYARRHLKRLLAGRLQDWL
jgi:RNA polymerase sigma-70 factor (ECF subfamily)